jgi:hypothetical protein
LYYEVYGLERGTPYRTMIRLEKEGGRSVVSAIGRLFGGGRAPVQLAFDAVAEARILRVRRALDLRDTPRGRYRLTLELSDPATGRTITRARSLEVVATP